MYICIFHEKKHIILYTNLKKFYLTYKNIYIKKQLIQ